MGDAIVRADALRWVADDFPGWFEVGVVDSDGVEHRIIEKVPVLTQREFTAASDYPTELWIRADTGRVEGERVQVTFAYGVQTTDGLTGVNIPANSVKWL